MEKPTMAERSDFIRAKNPGAVMMGRLSAEKRLKNKTKEEISLIMSEVRRGKR